MKIVEIVLCVLSLIGLSLLSQHYDGSAILTAIALISLALLYLIFSFALLNRINLRTIMQKSSLAEISFLRVIGSVVYGLIFGITAISILFEVNQFPGATILLWLSLTSLGLGIVVATIHYVPKNNLSPYYPILTRTIIGAIPVVWLIINKS